MHPTLTCNLRCAHCYTESGPGRRDEVDADALAEAVRDAAGLGYRVLAVSGGEPLMYPGLGDLLVAARRAGLRTVITTNGMLLRGRRAEALAASVDFVAVSVDGTPPSHDRIRRHEGAFVSMEAGIATLRELGIPFGVIFTLTQHNVHELEWVARFASDSGARLLQIHPLDQYGRATSELPDSSPDVLELAAALVESHRLRPVAPPFVHVDVVTLTDVRGCPERYGGRPSPGSERIGEWVPFLVVEADGTVSPLSYGFDRRFVLGRLGREPLRALADSWVETTASGFTAACSSAVRAIVARGSPVVSYWPSILAGEVRAGALSLLSG